MPFAHLDEVVAQVDDLAQRFERAGHRLYLVGGIVRDQWLDQRLGESSDIDLTTDARPDEIKRLIVDVADAVWTQGERFGTIGLRYRGHDLEITTHRAEHYDPDSRKPAVTFGDDIAVDLSRRDFTVNAMAVLVPSGEIVDPWGGVADLEAGTLRTPLDPAVSFGDDPLRMLRAARFGAKYGLTPLAGLVHAATSMRERLRIVAVERIGDELRRIFGLDSPEAAVAFLVETGLVEILLSWPVDPTPADPTRAETAHARLPDAVEVLGGVGGDWMTRLAVFLLAVYDAPEPVALRVERLRLSRDEQRTIVAGVQGACSLLELIGDARVSNQSSRLEDPSMRPALRRWGAATVDPRRSAEVARAFDARAQVLADAYDTLRVVEGLDAPEILGGGEIMALLDVGPGRIVGEAVEVLRQALFDQGPLPAAAQKELLTAWWAQRCGDV